MKKESVFTVVKCSEEFERFEQAEFLIDKEGKRYVSVVAMKGDEVLKPSGEKYLLDEKELEEYAINFGKWYSGMEMEKVRKAFERYKREVLNPNP